ncbi:hypothetical protein HN51_012412, partial [Arachis hypogaea]
SSPSCQAHPTQSSPPSCGPFTTDKDPRHPAALSSSPSSSSLRYENPRTFNTSLLLRFATSQPSIGATPSALLCRHCSVGESSLNRRCLSLTRCSTLEVSFVSLFRLCGGSAFTMTMIDETYEFSVLRIGILGFKTKKHRKGAILVKKINDAADRYTAFGGATPIRPAEDIAFSVARFIHNCARITLYANLYHYHHPQDLGLNCHVVVKNWITFDEPRVVAALRYDNGFFAPRRCNTHDPIQKGKKDSASTT